MSIKSLNVIEVLFCPFESYGARERSGGAYAICRFCGGDLLHIIIYLTLNRKLLAAIIWPWAF